MNRLVIIDDEVISLRQLSGVFDWKQFGFELAATFFDSRKALDYILRSSVDLVISDIRMPQLSGLDLARVCYTQSPNTCFIFTSAHRDFAYAQEATKYHVLDYLTKPLDFEALETALLRASKQIAERKRAASSHKVLRTFQKQALERLLCDTSIDTAELPKKLTYLGLPEDLLNGTSAVISVRMEKLQEYADKRPDFDLDSFYKNVSQLLPADADSFAILFRYSFDHSQVVLFPGNTGEDFPENVALFREKLEKRLLQELPVAFSLGNPAYFESFEEFQSQVLLQNKRYSSQAIIQQAEAYLEAHFGENITLKDVANHVSLSPVYFSAFFKKHTGQKFSVALTELRLKKALEYLKDTEIPVASICELVGYRNITHFYNLIKSRIQMTPNEYRQSARKSEEG